MLGKKVRMPPTPAIMPSQTREMSISSAPSEDRPLSARADKVSMEPWKESWTISPMKKVRKKTMAMMARKMGMPSHLSVK